MEDVAAEAGLTKRTLYNNFSDKDTLFRQMVDDTIAFAESFARGLDEEWPLATKANLAARLEALGLRLALGIIRPELVALRRMLIGHAIPCHRARVLRSRTGEGAARAGARVRHAHPPAHPAGA